MSKKFTEEQYHNIVDAWRRGMVYVESAQEVVDYLIDDMNVDVGSWGDKALAIANPLTREWAHEQFVEKEKKYYWNTKKKNEHGHSMNLLHCAGGVVQMMGPKDALTESEIKVWGYNPEMFDKEEVD